MPEPPKIEAPLVRIRGLVKGFDGRVVLDGVDLEIRRSESTVLIGPSSSGKTVLLKCLLGLHQPDAGEIVIEGVELARRRREDRELLADKLGVVFQRNALFDSLTTWENVAFRLLQRGGQSRAQAREIAIEKMQLFGLRPEVAERYPAEISGGMQKRAALARALATNPEVLLLDAPTDGLDPIMTRHTNDLIRRVVEEQGVTVFSITTDMRAAIGYSDRLAMLYGGRIIWAGSAAEASDAAEPHLRQLLAGSSEGPIRMALRA